LPRRDALPRLCRLTKAREPVQIAEVGGNTVSGISGIPN
jgi:hypothetical protein